jgi:hypothetical protein
MPAGWPTPAIASWPACADQASVIRDYGYSKSKIDCEDYKLLNLKCKEVLCKIGI